MLKARATLDLVAAIDAELNRDASADAEAAAHRLLMDVEQPLSVVLAGMERTGIAADTNYLSELESHFAAEVKAATGAVTLAEGAATSAAGAAELAAGADKASAGSVKLSDGITRAAAGATDVRNGVSLVAAANGEIASKSSTLSDGARGIVHCG